MVHALPKQSQDTWQQVDTLANAAKALESSSQLLQTTSNAVLLQACLSSTDACGAIHVACFYMEQGMHQLSPFGWA